jgi:hypothetical protein
MISDRRWWRQTVRQRGKRFRRSLMDLVSMGAHFYVRYGQEPVAPARLGETAT